MAKGKKKEGNTDKEIKKVEKEYTLLNVEEQKARDAKYAMRLMDLRACLSHIDEAFITVEELKDEEDILEKWNIYLRCDGLPKPYIPPEIRLFFAKLKFFENSSIEKTMDWMLSVDERSMLSQDIFRKDMTRRALVNQMRPNFGDEYKEYIDYLLKVVKSIDYYTDDDKRTAKAKISILSDILTQKKAAYAEIKQFFDHYTYRILSAEDSYMESVNATTAEYFYECENFCIHIWTLKNVPILFRFLEEPCLEASLHKLQLKVQLPLNILNENLTIRGLHLFFDPFSENAKSYRQEPIATAGDLTAGITDLHECLVHEHFMQADLQNEVRLKLIERRTDYENKAMALNEQLENLKKSKANADDKKKTAKLIKLPKEPPIITLDMYPDIWEDFLQIEQERFNNFINHVYHPDCLKLEEDEINLKNYTILGGIYQLYFVKKPTHYNFNDFNMTWHENNGELQIIKDVTAEEVLPASMLRTSSQISIIRPSAISRPSIGRHDRADSIPLMERVDYYDTTNFVISIDLPEYLCLWGEPLACHFEDDLIQYIDEPEPTIQESDKIKAQSAPAVYEAKMGIKEADTYSQYGLSSIDMSVTPRQSSTNISMRLRRSLSNVFRPSLALIASTQSQLQSSQHNIAEVEDFVLDLPLSIVQIRNIARHCIPRILSSFKFPVELQDEASEEQRGKPKGKGGILLRKRLSEDAEQTIDDAKKYQFDGQNNPERMFPVFPTPEKLNMEYIIRDNTIEEQAVTSSIQPKSFSDLVKTLDNIKKVYGKLYKRTFQVPDFKVKDPTKRKKQVRPVQRTTEYTMFKVPASTQSTASLPMKNVKLSKRKTSRGSEVELHKTKEQKEHDKTERETQTFRKQKAVADDLMSGHEHDEEEIKETAEETKVEDKRKSIGYSHWTTKYIKRMDYQKANRKIIIWTDRLGTIGLAYKLYEHFPFKNWAVEPDLENEGEVIFTLETQFVKCIIYISAKGYRGYVTEPTKGFVRHRKIYLDIKEPISDFKELKKRFRDHFLNIFSNHDARYYIENGYFSEKHLACELHTYSCIALHCLMLKYSRSDWNRLAQRRDIVLNFAHYREPPENMMQVRITPENATFVDIKELCSDNLDVFLLDYALTWRNIDNYSDFHHLIMSTYLAALDNRCKDPKLLVNLKNLLFEIRPLSYS
ncbi:uncharacterized protein [Eurosta solidaginis]|uniref:uncharacterized protein n=1 Tax=Eurosta solidaginis TaxID=178769 RepID=UPI0035314AAC